MGTDDVGAPLHRDMGVHITRGVEPWRISRSTWPRGRADMEGRQRAHGRPAARPDRDGQPPARDAAGRRRCALAFRIREEQRVAVGWSGEGAMARGDAHEGDELRRRASCRWSSSATTIGRRTRRRRISGTRWSTSRTTLRRTGSAASSSTARTCSRVPRGEARDREGARRSGPTLIECRTLRMEGHAGQETLSTSRRLEKWAARDAIERYRTWLRAASI